MLFSFSLFITTIGYFVQPFYFLPLLFSKFWKIVKSKKTYDFNFFLVVSIVLVAQFNLLFHLFFKSESVTQGIQGYITFVFLYPLAFLVAKCIDSEGLEILIKLIVFEGIVVLIEWYLGTESILPGISKVEEFSISDVLYNTRPYGLSGNSSGVSDKIFLAFLFMSYLNKKWTKTILFYVILITALILSFSRTAISAILFFYFLTFLEKAFLFYCNYNISKIKKIFYTISILFISTLIVIGLNSLFEAFIFQFSRGGDISDTSFLLSSRDTIWANFISFIFKNPFFGNGSVKYMIMDASGAYAHGHNSFIMILATHGLIITILYLFLIGFNINRYNWKFVFTICIYSFGQYMIFWGISFADIFFLFFLFLNKTNSINAEK